MSAPSSPMSVLLVEDDPDYGLLLLEYLELVARPCRAERVATLAQALAALSNQAYDLVISDLSLPDGDAERTLAALTAATGPRGTSLLFCSGFPRERLPASFGHLEPTSFLEKRCLDLAALELALDRAARSRTHG